MGDVPPATASGRLIYSAFLPLHKPFVPLHEGLFGTAGGLPYFAGLAVKSAANTFMAMPPLAERMRPQSLDEYLGQEHLTGPDGVLRRMLANGQLHSMIFWGPPGTGKTTLAYLLAKASGRPFVPLSAVGSGVKEIREVIEQARKGNGLVLFIDEIHRFNKSQQDALLQAVERGTITLIGATTENPSFEVNTALLSRCRVYTLRSLAEEDLRHLLERAVRVDEALNKRQVVLQDTAMLLQLSGGDARTLLNLLEAAAAMAKGQPVITDQLVQEAAQARTVRYDKTGEQHYDIISAFIKSLRGSDPNGAVYWLARMIEGGEDPVFIARRMVILASEDIGNANPTALVMAVDCMQAVHLTGWPEARIILSQCATYLAASPKSNAAYVAIESALAEVRKSGDLPVPLHLRNAPTRLMKDLHYSKGYQYAHDFEQNFSPQEYLPEALSGKAFYVPGQNAREEELRQRLRRLWKEKYGY